jgi:hypothetical protein
LWTEEYADLAINLIAKLLAGSVFRDRPFLERAGWGPNESSPGEFSGILNLAVFFVRERLFFAFLLSGCPQMVPGFGFSLAGVSNSPRDG